MSLPLQVAFVAGSSGVWRIERITAAVGERLPPAERLAVIEGPGAQRTPEGSWSCEAQQATRIIQTERSLRL